MWDLDGTILDSREAHFRSSQRVFENHGISNTKSKTRGLFGQTTRYIFSQILGDEISPEEMNKILWEKELAFREEVIKDAQLLPGVGRWLKEFHQRNIGQVIVSSTNKESIITTVKALEIDMYLTDIFSGELLPSKPDPAVFSAALEASGAEPDECLVVEDSPHGIQAAKAIDLKCIAAAITFTRNELADADLVVETLEQLQWKDINNLFA